VTAPATLTTARMRAERIGPQHRDGLIALLGDPRVGETLAGVRTPAEVDEQIERFAADWERNGVGWYAWLDRASGALIARGGIQPATVDGREEVELGWAVVPERWGERLAGELGAACADVAFGVLGLEDVVAFTLPHNVASRRVMEKLGMRFEKVVDYKTYGPHVVYRLRAGSRFASGAGGEPTGHADP
jgi:ribosomal-protein-alanine N-acetyltransferase